MRDSEPLRVAVTNWSSRRVGGIEEYLSLLIPALHGAGPAVAFWHEVDAPGDRRAIELPPGVEDICAAKLGVDRAIDALRDWRPDVIYAHSVSDPDLESRLQTLAPSVLFLHEYRGTCISGAKTFTRPVATPCDRTFGWPCLAQYFPRGCGGRSPITMWRQFQLQSSRLEVVRKYQSILTHTTHMKGEMAKHGVAVDVVPYPVAACIESPKTVPERGALRLLFAGRMDFVKGGRYLLDALPAVASATGRPITVTFAGDGPQRRSLEARARKVDAPNVSIQFAGWVTQERIGTLMADADVLVVPSLWPEPFGSVGPVAARHGVPAAAFDVGGIGEWLIQGVTGHLAPSDPPTPEGLARAIVRCLDDPDHHATLRAGAREMATRFTMAQHLPALMDALERAAAR